MESDSPVCFVVQQAAFFQKLFPTWRPRQAEEGNPVCRICHPVWQARQDQRQAEAEEAKSLAVCWRLARPGCSMVGSDLRLNLSALSCRQRGRDLRRLLGVGLGGIRMEYNPEEGERAYAVLLGRRPARSDAASSLKPSN